MSRTRSSSWVFGETGPLEDEYTLMHKIGQAGQFGVAMIAHVKGQKDNLVAVKIIDKARFLRRKNVAREMFDTFQQEVTVMQQMQHDNIIKYFKVFESSTKLSLVMELCTGGELFDRITARARYSEQDAANVLRQIMEALKYMHENKIAHCDLKPDNFLFLTEDENSPVKVIDFGMAKFVRRHKYFRKFCGTPYYVAPEVVKGEYNESCDIWSMGVVMFVMLLGYPPFYADPQKYGSQADEVVYRKIVKGFSPEIKPGYGSHFPAKIPISPGARDLITRMLDSDPTRRPTAAEVLDHPWMTGETAWSQPIRKDVIKSLRTFTKSVTLRNRVLDLMTGTLTPSEVDNLRLEFERMDTNRDGVVTVDELKSALVETEGEAHNDEVQAIIDNADIDGDGVLNYREMLLTYVNRKATAKEERIWHTFQRLDKDKNGRLSVEELVNVFPDDSQDKIRDMIAECDSDNNGQIDYEEFLAMFETRDIQPPTPRGSVDESDETKTEE